MTPLLLEECYYRLVEGRLVGRRVVVALTGLEACRGDLLKKACHLLVGRVGFPIKDLAGRRSLTRHVRHVRQQIPPRVRLRERS